MNNLNNLSKKLSGLIVQKYMENPSLIHKKKYDLRYFMIIACTRPYLVLTHTGYARLSLEELTSGRKTCSPKMVMEAVLFNGC